MLDIQQYIEDLISSMGFDGTDGLWLVWLSSALLLLISMISFLTGVISSYRKNYLLRWENAFNLKVEALLLELIYGEYSSYEAWKTALKFDEFENKYLSSKRGKKLFIRTLAVMRSRLNGEDAMRFAEIYRKTGLYKVSLRMLKSARWQIKAEGIRELGALNYVEAIPFIRPLVNHTHEEVRSLAQLALIQLDDTDPLGFLDQLNKPISLNAMIRLHGAMLQKASLDIPSFDRWLISTQPDVVLFATKMAGLFNAAADEARLAELVSHPNLTIARAAIVSLEQLVAQNTLIELIPKVTQSAPELQLQLIQSLGNLGYQEEDQLEQWLRSDDFEIAKAAFEIAVSGFSQERLQAILARPEEGTPLFEIRNQRIQYQQKLLS